MNRFLAPLLLALSFSICQAAPTDIYVSPTGNDMNPGTLERPVATLAKAQILARAAVKTAPITVYLGEGKYNLDAPLVFTSADSGTATAPVTYQAYGDEKPVVGSGMPLALLWSPYKNGIMQAIVPATWNTDQLFVNGHLQIMARYPNYDPNVAIYNGFCKDVIDSDRVAKWSDPTGGFIHVLHGCHWGGFSYIITGKRTDSSVSYQGGFQTNRQALMDRNYMFVENIFEELDAPGEWYLNHNTHTLYFYPPAGVDPNQSLIEGVKLANLVEFRGSEKDPVRYVTMKGITFTQAARTFMSTKETILRTDWAIYRGGAILFNGAENCSLIDSTLTELGGNGVFVNGYNRHITIDGCHLYKLGAGGVNFVGSPNAVRNALSNIAEHTKVIDTDLNPGPQASCYPSDCLVNDCLIHDTGTIEKQSSPVEIDIAANITVNHCSIYHCPRAGINIGDGCFGGDVIEFCDVFDTVRETGDQGALNSWGRDRFWNLQGINLWEDVETKYPDLPRLDCQTPITLNNNRWRCDHGWDIDLDDGASNFIITNNVCLKGGIKTKDGFYRVISNNILVNCSLSPLIWFNDCQDIFTHNILASYNPGVMISHPWGKEMDRNLFEKPGQSSPYPAADEQKQSGWDQGSEEGDPLFVNVATGNYQVQPTSPAIQYLGFKNFPMDQFGVEKPELKALAETPDLPPFGGITPIKATKPAAPINLTNLDWNGISGRNIKDADEMASLGLPGMTGVLVTKIDADSPLAKAGVAVNDVILGLNDKLVSSVVDLQKLGNLVTPFTVNITREQMELTLKAK